MRVDVLMGWWLVPGIPTVLTVLGGFWYWHTEGSPDWKARAAGFALLLIGTALSLVMWLGYFIVF